MNRKRMHGMALAGALSLLAYTATANAQSQARTELKNAEGKKVGTATLRQTKNGVAVALEVNGLSPGLHAVHVHAVGKCEAPAFTSAGGHFNPANKKHGLKSSEGPHAGDLPNMYVNQNGVGRYEVLVSGITLASGETSAFDADGSAIVVHAGGDDDATDPSGNSGDRVACGALSKPVRKG